MSRAARRSARGSALVAVLLVVLVLTIVGIGVAFYTSTEDRTAGNADLARVGFYAAEAGLREAESAIATYAAANAGIVTPLLAVPADPKDVYRPPGSGNAAYLLRLAARTYRNVVLGPQVGLGATRPMYSVFVRNNPEDTGGPNTDTDRRVNVVVVGQAVLVDGAGAPVLDGSGNPTMGITKVLEEQIETNPEGSAAATQKGTNVGGTSSGAK
jgi:hypothetical protein